MEEPNKKVTFTVSTSIWQLAFIIISILLSTGIWQPASNFFLWDWLTFSPSHIIGPILTILFIPVILSVIVTIVVVVAILLLILIVGFIASLFNRD